MLTPATDTTRQRWRRRLRWLLPLLLLAVLGAVLAVFAPFAYVALKVLLIAGLIAGAVYGVAALLLWVYSNRGGSSP